MRELLDLDLAISIIRSAPLTFDDAERIVRVLKDRQLIQDATVGVGPCRNLSSAFWNVSGTMNNRRICANDLLMANG